MKSFRAYRLPCDVDYRGEVENREEYFSIAEVPEGFSEVQFRGRMLRGVAMDGVQGMVVCVTEEGKRREVIGKVSEGGLWYWNHDVVPNAELDTVPRAVRWMRIASVLSKPMGGVGAQQGDGGGEGAH
mmetsp:Transcript_3064/g.5895  ORF Transcript_3064/g.5895 Transcript_3064/m.5895 type:complete len:128 (+) Transcript_3064:64-447(+)